MMKNELHTIGFDHTDMNSAPPLFRFLGGDLSALVVTALFLFSVLSVPKFNLAAVVVFAAFPLFLIGAAQAPAGVIAKRLLRLSPFVFFMAAGNLILDRTPMWILSGFTITGGMMSAMVIMTKTMISVAGMLSVTLCIPFYRICRALEAFHVPEVLVTQLMLLYRYSSVLQEEALSMQKARDLRSFGRRGREFSNTASLVGSLLLRTVNRAERLYRAMAARGFHGQMSTRHGEKISPGDWKTIALWSLLFLALRLIF